MKANEFITEAVKQRLDPKCWKGKHKEGTKIKGGVRVNNCVPNESVEEAANAAQQSAIAIAKKKKSGVAEGSISDLLNQDPTSPKFNDHPGASQLKKAKGYTPSAGELARDLIKTSDDAFKSKYGMSKKQAEGHYSSSNLKEQGVTEGIMDVVKKAYNDCVVGYPQGTSEGQFLQGWARAIRAETGRDIPLEKLTKLYHDYTERSPEIMQSHGTVDESGVVEAAGAMPVNKYIANELDTLLKLAQDQAEDITNRSRSGYGNKKSSGLEDAIFELSGVSNGFHSSMEEGIAELQELNNGLPRIGNWIIRNLKKVGNRIDLPQLIKQETSEKSGVAEGMMDKALDKENRARLRNRIAADALNFYSLNDRIPRTSEFSRSVKSKLNSLEFDERSELYRQGVVQALKLLGKQGYFSKLGLDEGEADPKPVTTGHFADKKSQPKPYPALKNTRTGKVRPHPNDPDQGVTEGSDDSGAYDKWDPKHPDFVKNYRKFQASNPGATLKDFVARMKSGVSETAAWRRKEGKSKTGGLNKKGVASYRRENPGSKLQTAVTTKPSKLKKGSKASKRRKSFCARMGGVKGPMKKPNGKPTRKALALRKWNCESVEQLQSMLMIAESWAREHEGK